MTPPIPPADPSRLLTSDPQSAPALRAYARHTQPGAHEGVAAWYRLAARLSGAPRPPSPRWRAVRWAATATAGLSLLFALSATAPEPGSGLPLLRPQLRPGGESGAGAGPAGAGGMEGNTGARGSAGAALAEPGAKVLSTTAG